MDRSRLRVSLHARCRAAPLPRPVRSPRDPSLHPRNRRSVMTRHTLELLLILAGVAHLCITSAGVAMTLVLDWRRNLTALDALTRHIIWVHGAFVLLTIVAFGLISILFRAPLASGEPLARAACGFIAIFWGFRLLIAFFLFDATPFLKSFALKLGYHGLTVVFVYFALVYTLAAALPKGAVR